MRINKFQINMIIGTLSLLLIVGFYFTYYQPKQDMIQIQENNIAKLSKWIDNGEKLKTEQNEYFEYLSKKEQAYEEIYEEKINEVNNILPTEFSEPAILNALTELSKNNKVDLQISKANVSTFKTDMSRSKTVLDGQVSITFDDYERKINKENEDQDNEENDNNENGSKVNVIVKLTLNNKGNTNFPLRATEDYELKTNKNSYSAKLYTEGELKFNSNDEIDTGDSQKIALLFEIPSKEIEKELVIKKLFSQNEDSNENNTTDEANDPSNPNEPSDTPESANENTTDSKKDEVIVLNADSTNNNSDPSTEVTQIKYSLVAKSEFRSLMFFMYNLQNLKMINKIENFVLEYNDEIFYPDKISESLIDRYDDFPLKSKFDLIFYKK